MKCPVCSESALVMTARQGIEIDYCPQCRGVWLDRGELDKIIERSMAETAAAPWPGDAGQHGGGLLGGAGLDAQALSGLTCLLL